MQEREFGNFCSAMGNLLQSLHPYSQNKVEDDRIYYFKQKIIEIAEEKIYSEEEIRNIFWDEFKEFIDSYPPDSHTFKEVIDKEPYPIVWGHWNWYDEIELPYGHGEKHEFFVQGNNNKNGRHIYKGRPKIITWFLNPIKENDEIKYYTTHAPICEIDAICSVPSIKHGMKIFQASRRILNPDTKLSQWQRELDSTRLLHISDFLDNKDNTFSNPCMIFAPNHSSVEWDENERMISIDFQFLTQDRKYGQGYLTDNNGAKDLRPLKIIDGQHRIRGGMRSKRGHKLTLPIIIFPPKLRNKGAAKIFSEINTLAEPLHILHEMFMRHKFSLGSKKEKMNFTKYDGKRRTNRARANRLSYEAAAYLNIHKPVKEENSSLEIGAMCNLIRMLEENQEKNVIISADIWVQFSWQWFMPEGPHPPDGDMDENPDGYFLQIANYFDAFSIIANRNNDDGMNWRYYDTLRKNDTANVRKPVIQYSLPFRALILIYGDVVKSIREAGYNKKIISRDRFIQSMRLFENIDWIDTKMRKIYTGSGEYKWKSLTVWMQDTLKRGDENAYDYSEIMSNEICSVRGKGILAEISKGEIEFRDKEQTWPKKEKDLEIVLKRPINASSACTISLFDENDNTVRNKAGLKGKYYANPDEIILQIKYWDEIEDNKSLKLICSWGNAVNIEVSCAPFIIEK